MEEEAANPESEPSPDSIEGDSIPVNKQPEAAAIPEAEPGFTYHFTSEDHLKMGEDTGRTFARFVPCKVNSRRNNFIIHKFIQVLHQQLLLQYRLEQELIKKEQDQRQAERDQYH